MFLDTRKNKVVPEGMKLFIDQFGSISLEP